MANVLSTSSLARPSRPMSATAISVVAMGEYRSLENPAFQQGTKFDQFVAAFDLIVRF